MYKYEAYKLIRDFTKEWDTFALQAIHAITYLCYTYRKIGVVTKLWYLSYKMRSQLTL